MSDYLKKYRAASPDLADLSDDELVSAIHAASGVGGDPYEYGRKYLGVKDKGSRLKDTAVDFAKGVVGVGQIVTGGLDLATGGLWSKTSEKLMPGRNLEAVKKELGDEHYSTKRKQANRAVEQAEGFTGTVKAIVNNPSTALGWGVESLPTMAIPMGVGKLAGKAAVRGAQDVGPQLSSHLARESMVANNLGQTAGWTGVTAGQTAARIQAEDPGNTDAMYKGSLGAAAIVGGLTHGASLLPGGNIARQAIGGGRRLLDSTANQAGQLVGQGVGQTGAENLALGRPLEEGMSKAIAAGLVNAPVFGALGAKKRPDFMPPPRVAEEAEGSQAPFTTEDLINQTIVPATGDMRSIVEQTTGVNRPASPNNAESMEAALSEPTSLYGQNKDGIEHPIDYGQLIAAQFKQPKEGPAVQDPAAAALAGTPKQGKGGKQKEPDYLPEEAEALFAKYGRPEIEQVKRPDGTVIMQQHGEPLTISHWDTSRTPNSKTGAVLGYDTPEQLQKAVAKMVKKEREKPESMRVAEQVMSDAINEGLGRRPTSREVDKLSNLVGLRAADSPERVIRFIDRELAKLETSNKPDMFVKDALTMWRKAIDDKSEPMVERVKVPEDGKPAAPKAAKPAAPKQEPELPLAAPRPAPAVSPIERLNALADSLAGDKQVITIRDANNKASTMTKSAYVGKLAAMKGKDLTRLQQLMGIDSEGHQVANPMTHAEIAASEGVTATAITKWAKKFGLTEDTVNRVVRNDLDEVSVAQESEFVSNAAEGEEASGFSVRSDAGDLNTGGFHGMEYTARDQRNDAIANTFMKTGAVPNTIKASVDPRAEAAAEQLKLREKEAETLAAQRRAEAQRENIRQMIQQAVDSPHKEAAQAKYEELRAGNDELMSFIQLSDEAKVRWIVMVDEDIRLTREGEEGLPRQDYIDLMKEYNERDGKSPTIESGPVAAGGPGDAEVVRSDGDQDDAQTAGEARSPAVVTKKRRLNTAGFVAEPQAQIDAQVAATKEGRKGTLVLGKKEAAKTDLSGLAKAEVTGKDGDTAVVASKDPAVVKRATIRAKEVGLKQAMGEAQGAKDPTLTSKDEGTVVQHIDDATGHSLYDEVVRPEDAGSVKPMEGTTTKVTTGEEVVNQRAAGSAESEAFTANEGTYGSAEELIADIKKFMGVKSLGSKVRIIDANTATEADRKTMLENPRWQAWANYGTGKVTLRSDRIFAGEGRAVFLHEIGSHLGIDNLLPPKARENLVHEIGRWAMKDDAVGQIARKALDRVTQDPAIDTKPRVEMETIAYFVEEATLAGMKPTASPQYKRFLTRVMHFFKEALRKMFGTVPAEMTAQDVIDLAYGAARKNLTPGSEIKYSPDNFKGAFLSGSARKSKVEENIKKLPPALQKPVRGVVATVRDTSGRWAMKGAMLPDLADWAAKNGMPSAKRFYEFAARKGAFKHEMDQKLGAVVKIVQDLEAFPRTQALTYLKDSTMNQKWGYQPTWRDKVAVDPAEAAKWKALPKEAQNAVDAMLKYNDGMWEKKRQAILDARMALQTELVASAEARGADQAEMDAIWADMDKLMEAVPKKLDGPYAPLKRFGNFVVTLKSRELQEAQATNRKKYTEMLNDPKHYIVEHHDSTYAAANRAAELAEQNPNHTVDYSAKEKHEYLGAGFETLERLKQAITDRIGNEDSKYAVAAHKALHEAIIQSMGEYNARTNSLQRKNIAGVDPEEMARAFAAQGFADNRFLSSVLHNREMNDAMSMLRKEARTGGDRTLKQDFYNEFKDRLSKASADQTHPFFGHAMKFTTMWRLVTSPAYYLQYVTQPVTMFLPAVQGRHGYSKAAGVFVDSMKSLFPAIKGNDLDLSKVADKNERKMLKDLLDTGTISMGFDQMFGHVETIPDTAVSKAWAKATAAVNRIPMALETRNRSASAIAAFRLEMQKSNDVAKATDYARDIINQTYGDYNSYSAPSITMGGGGRKLIFQYRQFQFIHTALLTRLLHNAMKGMDHETKRAARLQLAYMAGHYGVLAGALGVPAANLVGGAIRAVFGDDEDKDVETFVKRHVESKAAQDMILGGIPRALMGIDISAKVGAGDILSPARYVDLGKALEDKQGMAEVVFGLMGPFASLLPQLVEGGNLIADGDMYRGLEKLMPKGIGDTMKGIRFGTEGVVDKRGRTLIPEDEVGVGTAVAQAAGLRPTKISSPQHDAFMASNIAYQFKEEAGKIKSKYIRAKKNGEPTAEIVAEWKDMMARQKKAGLKPANLGTLMKAPSAMKKSDAMVVEGVPYTAATKGLVENVVGAGEDED